MVNAPAHGSREAELLEAALSCARRGWHVVPLHTPAPDGCSCGRADCASPGKHPRTRHGLKDATTDEQAIREWWEASPLANIGVATGSESGLFVLDVDGRHGGDDSLAALRQEHGSFPTTVGALTGSGEHIYFAHPGTHVPTNAGKLGEGLDIRGDGGYVVVPPSLHSSGRLYAWEGSGDPEEVTLASAPPWLLELIATSSRQKAELGAVAPGAKIPVGRRREAWKTLAAQLHNDGTPFEQKVRLMMAFAAEMFESPETAQEADARGIAQWYENREAATPFTVPIPQREREPGEDDGPSAAAATAARPEDWLRPGEGLGRRSVPMARVSLSRILPTLHEGTRGGLPTGSVVSLQGPPDAAKTGVAQTIADEAERQGWTVVHFAPDNGREPAEIRYGQLMGFDRTKLEEGDEAELEGFRRAFEARRIFMPDPDLCDEKLEPVNTLAHVMESAKKLFPAERVIFLADSIQTLKPDGERYESPRLQVIATMKLLRKAANNPGWLVIATCQIHREAFKHSKGWKNTVRLAAGAESTSIEFGCDLILFLNPTDSGISVEVTKNKPGSGRKPTFGIQWDRERARASETDQATFAEEVREMTRRETEKLWSALEAIVAKEAGLSSTRVARLAGRQKAAVLDALDRMATSEPPRIRRVRTRRGDAWFPVPATAPEALL